QVRPRPWSPHARERGARDHFTQRLKVSVRLTYRIRIPPVGRAGPDPAHLVVAAAPDDDALAHSQRLRQPIRITWNEQRAAAQHDGVLSVQVIDIYPRQRGYDLNSPQVEMTLGHAAEQLPHPFVA